MLKKPFILQNNGIFLDFVFVSDNIAGVRSRNAQKLYFQVGNQISAFHLEVCAFSRIFVFYFVVFALGGNTPPAKAIDLLPGRAVGDAHLAVMASVGSQDLVHAPLDGLYFVSGKDGNVGLGVEQDGVGFFVVRRERDVDHGMHPGRRIARDGGCRADYRNGREHRRNDQRWDEITYSPSRW